MGASLSQNLRLKRFGDAFLSGCYHLNQETISRALVSNKQSVKVDWLQYGLHQVASSNTDLPEQQLVELVDFLIGKGLSLHDWLDQYGTPYDTALLFEKRNIAKAFSMIDTGIWRRERERTVDWDLHRSCKVVVWAPPDVDKLSFLERTFSVKQTRITEHTLVQRRAEIEFQGRLNIVFLDCNGTENEILAQTAPQAAIDLLLICYQAGNEESWSAANQLAELARNRFIWARSENMVVLQQIQNTPDLSEEQSRQTRADVFRSILAPKLIRSP